MIIKSKTILNKYDNIFNALFFSDIFIDKYAVLYDRLIKDDEIKAQCYLETDTCILEISENLNNLSYLTEMMLELPCDLMFDLYHRYHILAEYLLGNDEVTVSSPKNKKLFIELFTKTWVIGIPTFSHKYF